MSGIKIRVSDIAKWSQCEAYAFRGRARERDDHSLSAAALVGNIAHATLAEINYEITQPIRWDRTTPGRPAALKQAQDIVAVARKMLADNKMTILARETAHASERWLGHSDLIVRDEVSRDIGIVDLKTGQQLSTAWLQVGGYLELAQDETIQLMIFGAVLHVPRTKDGEPKAAFATRGADLLRQSFRAYETRIASIVDDFADELRRPGYHCRSCSLDDCVVRTEEFDEARG